MKSVYSLFACVFLLALTAAPGCAKQDDTEPAADAAATAEGDQDNTFYAMGLAMAQGLAQFNLTADELEHVQEGLADGVLENEPRVELEEYMPQIQQLAQTRAEATAVAERAAGEAAVATAAAEAGAVKTESGMVYRQITAGTGASPAATDTVTVHYKGTLRDGTVFDSSYDRGQPATFALNQVIPCWTEGVQTMQEGGKAELTCPPDLAYGDRAAGKIPPGATLHFEVELIKVGAADAPAPPAADGSGDNG